MAWNKRSVLVASLVMAACLAMAGAAAAQTPGAVCKAAASVPGETPAPLDLQTLHPDCCRSISTVPEATCDSVSWSVDRCNQYGGGGLCAWTCSCCQPISGSGYSWAYCAQFDAYGADRCNQVWQGNACHWTC